MLESQSMALNMKIFTFFKEKAVKLPLDLFSHALMTSKTSPKPLTCPSRPAKKCSNSTLPILSKS